MHHANQNSSALTVKLVNSTGVLKVSVQAVRIRRRRRFSGFLAGVIVLSFFISGRGMCAGLISSISLNNILDVVSYDGEKTAYVTETTTPFSVNQNVSFEGASVAASYTLTDDGTNAILRIVRQLSVPSEFVDQNGVHTAHALEEPQGPAASIELTFSHPVYFARYVGFNFNGNIVATYGAHLYLGSSTSEGFNAESVGMVGSNPSTNLPPKVGYLSGTGTYNLQEEFEISNATGPPYSGTSGSGTISFEIVFSLYPPAVSYPLLFIGNPQTNNLVISWPFEMYGYSLEQATDLKNGNWNVVTNVPVLVNTNYTVTVPTDQQLMFFRLHHP